MPVEIRELIIRAQVPDKTDASGQNMPSPPVQMVKGDANEQADYGDAPPSAEWVQKVADICLKEMKSWLIEKSIR